MKAAPLDAFGRALAEAVKVPRPDLQRDLLSALKIYAGSNQAAARVTAQRKDATARLTKAARVLQKELRRADAVFGAAPVAQGEWTTFLPHAWRDLAPELAVLLDRIEAWEAARATPPARRGAPHPGRFHLRIRTFEVLQHHGIRIVKNGERSPAARTLAAVLAEADRIDGAPARQRASFNGTQWSDWVQEYRRVNALFSRGERSGLSRSHLRDLIQHLNPSGS